MSRRDPSLNPDTRNRIAEVFDRLDYKKLGAVYCDEGGDAFWRDRRGPCQRIGLRLARALNGRLRPGGRSLYVGAGVPEIPTLLMETLELSRTVVACNLRRQEVAVLNRACGALPLRFRCETAFNAQGRFDHIWMVSVLNDPERFPELSALSYGRANPVSFHAGRFVSQREAVRRLVGALLRKLSLPALITTSVEEVQWMTSWCARGHTSWSVETASYPTALVGDPLCFIRVGQRR